MLHKALRAAGAPVVVALFLLVSLSFAVQAASRDRLEAFLHITGFDVALDSIALAAEDAPVMLGMRAEEFGFQWKRAAEEVFETDRMRGMAIDLLEKTLSDELLGHAAAFYATPLGLRLVAVENESHMVEDDAVKRAAGDQLIEAMRQDDPARQALLERMNAAIDSADMGLRAVVEIQLRFILAADEAGVLDLKLGEDELRALLTKDEDEMRQSMTASALANSAYTYRAFSNEELEAYAVALEDVRMQQVYDLMNAIQWEIMANRFEALAVKMAGMSLGEEL